MKAKLIALFALVAVVVAVLVMTLSMRQNPTAPAATPEPMDRKTFVRVYADLAVAGEKIGVGTPEYEAVRDSILKSYATTFEGFTGMQATLDATPEEWAKVWGDILAELKNRHALFSPTDSVIMR